MKDPCGVKDVVNYNGILEKWQYDANTTLGLDFLDMHKF
jgi:hypothetical protein